MSVLYQGLSISGPVPCFLAAGPNEWCTRREVHPGNSRTELECKGQGLSHPAAVVSVVCFQTLAASLLRTQPESHLAVPIPTVYMGICIEFHQL